MSILNCSMPARDLAVIPKTIETYGTTHLTLTGDLDNQGQVTCDLLFITRTRYRLNLGADLNISDVENLEMTDIYRSPDLHG